MSRAARIALLAVVVAAVVGVVAMKQRGDEAGAAAETQAQANLPRLVDLGADKCIPCKKMAPILATLEHDLAGQCDVHFIDVWKNPAEGPKYGIKVIPTQIFLGADGTELFRHEGFISREDILKKFAEHGYTFEIERS